jgi:hypothetical protein
MVTQLGYNKENEVWAGFDKALTEHAERFE